MVERSHTADAGSGHLWPNLMEPLRNVGHKIAEFFAPSADAAASDEHYEINVELPGVKADDVHVELNHNVLTVKGEKHFAREEKGKTYYFSERRFGAFHRSFRLPEDVAGEDVTADFKDGVLKVQIPKRKRAEESARRIQVSSS